jgi:hypothetical protein
VPFPRNIRPKVPSAASGRPAYGPEFTFELGSADDPDAFVDGVGFAEALAAHIKALRQTAEYIAEDERVLVRYELVDLKRNSPPSATLRGVVWHGDAAILEQAEQTFAGIVSSVETNAAIPNVDYPLLRALQNLGDLNRKYNLRSRFISARLSAPITATRRVGDRLDIVLQAEPRMNGSVEGYLRYLNFHRRATMRIFPEPELNLPYVTCRFPKQLEDAAAAAARHYVVVYGEVRYRPGARYPHHITASRLEVLDRAADFPPYAQTVGLAREFTAGKSTEDIVSEARRGW